MQRNDVDTECLRAELAERLDKIERAADARVLSRGSAGDAIREEVVDRLVGDASPEALAILFRAELARARLYFASAAKTPLDAATALLFAAEHDAALPPDQARSEAVAPLARAVLERLRPLKSKRRAFRVFMAYADALAVAPSAAGRVQDLLELAPAYLDGALRRFPQNVVGSLLDKIQAAIRRDESLEPDLRDRLQAKLFRLAVDAEDPRRAAEFWPGAAFVQPDDVERLAAIAAKVDRLDDWLMGVIENALRAGDEQRRRLERAMRARALTDGATPEEALPSQEGFNRRMAAYYGAEAWPWQNLVRIAVRRNRPADAFAAFARLAEAATDLRDAPAQLAPLLLAAGFRGLASEFGHGPTALLARAEAALDADPCRISDELLDELECMARDGAAPAPISNRAAQLRGRAAAAAGRTDDAVEHLQRALSRESNNGDIASDLAEALAAGGDLGRARAFATLALESGDTPRRLELLATTLEAAGDVIGAAAAFKRAVDLDLDDAPDAAPSPRAEILAESERCYARFAGARNAGASPFLERLRSEIASPGGTSRRGLLRPESTRRRAAHLADQAGRPRDVLAILAPIRARLAADEDLAALAARAATEIGRAADALVLLAPFGETDDARVRTARGQAFAALGRADDAARELEAAHSGGDLERAGAALVRLDLARSEPAAAGARCTAILEAGGLSPAATAAFERLHAEAFEASGETTAALSALVRSIATFESDAARIQYARVAATAAIEIADVDARQEYAARAKDAVAGVRPQGAEPWASLASAAMGRAGALTLREVAQKLEDLSLDCGPGGRSRTVVDAWIREKLEIPTGEIPPATAPIPMQEPPSPTTNSKLVGPYE